MIAARMRAVVLRGHGGPEQLDVRDDVPVPSVGDGEVLIEVAAAGVNQTDINTRVGWYEGGGWTGSFVFPRIQGIDACGRVVAVGVGVASSRVANFAFPVGRRAAKTCTVVRDAQKSMSLLTKGASGISSSARPWAT